MAGGAAVQSVPSGEVEFVAASVSSAPGSVKKAAKAALTKGRMIRKRRSSQVAGRERIRQIQDRVDELLQYGSASMAPNYARAQQIDAQLREQHGLWGHEFYRSHMHGTP